MLIFNGKDKYETIGHSSVSSRKVAVTETSLKSNNSSKTTIKNKLTKSNIKFLKSLGFILNPSQ